MGRNLGPRIRRVVLSKEGLAHVERRGSADGSFELPFGRAELGEVLRSLVVWVERGEGRTTALAFDAPEDPDAALAERKLRFEPGTTLRGIVHAARGRRVRTFGSDGPIEGEVLGFEESTSGQGPRRWLLLRTGAGQIEVVDMASVRQIELADPALQGSLDVLVSRGRASAGGDGRAVRVGLAGRVEDVRVLYVVPAAPFQLSYRLALAGAEARLFAFALVQNPLDEDLEDVELVLSSAQAAAASSDSYGRGDRRIDDETENATKLERTRRAHGQPATIRAAAPLGTLVALAGRAPERIDDADTMDTEQAAAELAAVAAAEPREWVAEGPVSIPRRGAAMIPVLATSVRVRKERLFREGAGPSPDLVLCFDNDTGVRLDEGRCAVYDEGRYVGESAIGAATRGALVRVSFTKDPGVRCHRTSRKDTTFAGVVFEAGGLIEQRRVEERHAYCVRSDHSTVVDVVIEIPRKDGRTLTAEGLTPLAETPRVTRFRVEVPPRGEATIEVREVWTESTRLAYESVEPGQIETWRASGRVAASRLDVLSELSRNVEEATQLEAERMRLDRELVEVYTRHGKIAEQLAVLRDAGPEGALRARYVSELDAMQQRIGPMETEMRRLRDEAETRRRAAERALASLAQCA
ncbi:hypothetical protein [Polyangium jinanense]|uniref:DUF4139 domain-containing protein n=1 Tax=Polyangium jinanense TaxID=2829994 RepID=A0A9X4AS93_9BACT|nr:hypothetical protein [Polyangium jinanense]MDC3954597.1 hypothetical protein [Polyangium jinanense]MDC3980900.1 hypothetical protein [Polyangium jinanense]